MDFSGIDCPRPSHTYAWFVMTDCDTLGRQVLRNQSLEEAVCLYQDRLCSEKQLDVTFVQ